MKRRAFITLLGGATAWPLAARAQQAGKLPTIGFLGTNTASSQRQWTDAFLQRLRELGWVEGRTIAITYRWAEGRNERFAEIADELVRMKVDVIVTGGGAVPAVKQMTSVIPIVFAVKRSGRFGLRRESGAAGRQRYRPNAPGPRPRRQTDRTLA
jgi:ABC-type uncharacterized transport system substrate-binding protein